MSQSIVVTGMGLLTSLGTGKTAFLENLASGKTALCPIRAFDTADCRSHIAGKIGDFDASRYIDSNKLRRIDAVGRIAVSTARLALDDAGLVAKDFGSDDMGVVLGSFTAGIHSTVEYCKGLVTKGPHEVIPLIFSNTVGNAPASLCSLLFGLRGPNATISHKEASGLAAIAYATGVLRREQASAVLAGGADDIDELFFRIHDRLGVLSPRDGSEERLRPFDRWRNGFILGEGGYMHLLETRQRAERRDARIYAEILGVGASSSPCDINEWAQDPSPLSRCMEFALADANCDVDDIDLLIASANGTQELDRTEAAAIETTFGTNTVPVASIKGAIGEFAGVGSASAAAAILSLRGRFVPPTTGFEEPDPELSVDVSPVARNCAGSTALVNSFASGGTNYSIVVRVC